MTGRTRAAGKPREGLCWGAVTFGRAGWGSTVPLLVPFVPFCGMQYFTTSISHVTSGKLFIGRDHCRSQLSVSSSDRIKLHDLNMQIPGTISRSFPTSEGCGGGGAHTWVREHGNEQGLTQPGRRPLCPASRINSKGLHRTTS